MKISEKSFNNFLSYLADIQTNEQTNKLWEKHNLLSGGKKTSKLLHQLNSPHM